MVWHYSRLVWKTKSQYLVHKTVYQMYHIVLGLPVPQIKLVEKGGYVCAMPKSWPDVKPWSGEWEAQIAVKL